MRKHRWAARSLVLVAVGVAVGLLGAMDVRTIASKGATAEETTIVRSTSSPGIYIAPLDSLVLPLLTVTSPPPPPPAPAEPAVATQLPPPTTAPPIATQIAPPPPPPAPPAPVGPGGLAGSLLAAMNADRAAYGLAPLAWNGQLAGIAQNWAYTIAQRQSLTHQNMNGVAAQTGFARTGENLLYASPGYTPADMESLWMNSPPHRANILDPRFTMVGVGVATSPDGLMWAVADFGG